MTPVAVLKRREHQREDPRDGYGGSDRRLRRVVVAGRCRLIQVEGKPPGPVNRHHGRRRMSAQGFDRLSGGTRLQEVPPRHLLARLRERFEFCAFLLDLILQRRERLGAVLGRVFPLPVALRNGSIRQKVVAGLYWTFLGPAC